MGLLAIPSVFAASCGVRRSGAILLPDEVVRKQMTAEPAPGTGQHARVQGDAVRVRDTYVRTTFGVDAQERYRSAASSGLRSFFRQEVKPAGGWVPFELFVEAVLLADRMFGKGDLGLVREMGEFSATHGLPVWKRLLMRRVSPATMLSLASSAWSHHYDGGRLLSRVSGANGLFITISDFPTPHRAHCLSVAGWTLGSLKMGPRKNAAVRELGCRAAGDRSCDFQLSWDN